MDDLRAPFSGLIGNVGAKTAALLRAEMDLLSSEMQLKLSACIVSGIWLAVGALFLVAAFVLALTAMVGLLIAFGIKIHVAAAILAVTMAALGALVLLRGLAKIRSANLKPERSLAQLRNDAGIFKRSTGDA